MKRKSTTKKRLALLYLALILPFSAGVVASGAEPVLPSLGGEGQSESILPKEQEWGVAIGLRSADIPFHAKDESVEDILPLLFFENDRFFLRGLEGGIKLFSADDWGFNLLGRYRFFDIPETFQNEVRGSGTDFGFQAERVFGDVNTLSLELMSDTDGRIYANARIGSSLGGNGWSLRPSLGVRLKSRRFNDRYYGLDVASPGSGVDFDARVQGRYRVWRELHLIGSVGGRYLGSEVKDLPHIEDRWSWELFAGLAFFSDSRSSSGHSLPDKAYIRLAHGWATPSNLGEIIRGKTEKDPYNNQLTSAFYGHPLADSLLGLPLDIYLTPGLVFHHSSEVQDPTVEYVLAIKAYYTFKLPWRMRFGFAEGLSYTARVPYVEQSEMDRKGYRASRLLNYLDFSLDINLGDMIKSSKLKTAWLGYSIHHRSGIFESSSAFGRIRGGSNYNTVYLQWHF